MYFDFTFYSYTSTYKASRHIPTVTLLTGAKINFLVVWKDEKESFRGKKNEGREA
jgi:hypothetical protein